MPPEVVCGCEQIVEGLAGIEAALRGLGWLGLIVFAYAMFQGFRR